MHLSVSDKVCTAAFHADRRSAGKIATRFGFGLNHTDRMDFIMDVQAAACAENGNRAFEPSDLLAADDVTFLHDCGGIRRHMNRETGALEGWFMPRICAVTERRLAEEVA